MGAGWRARTRARRSARGRRRRGSMKAVGGGVSGPCGHAQRPRFEVARPGVWDCSARVARGLEGGADELRDLPRLPLELAVGEAERAIAVAQVHGVAAPVALERLARAVVPPAVGFDDEPLFGEEEVDLLAAEGVVDL